jgi:hypothetical protein
MSKPRIKKTTFAGSSNKLRARALTRVGLEHFITNALFNPQLVRTNYANC